jgi:hypothetical protein
MAESFLEEQLKRIKEMTEQMSRLRPFREISDVRNHSSEQTDAPPEDPSSALRRTRRGSSRRRAR